MFIDKTTEKDGPWFRLYEYMTNKVINDFSQRRYLLCKFKGEDKSVSTIYLQQRPKSDFFTFGYKKKEDADAFLSLMGTPQKIKFYCVDTEVASTQYKFALDFSEVEEFKKKCPLDK
jgi:hypothetical protein